MNRIFFLLVALFFISNPVFADLEPTYTVVKSTKNPKLTGKSVTYTFTFSGHISNFPKADSIIYQMDGNGKNKKVKVNKDKFVVKTTAGKHSFTIWYSNNYKEIYTTEILAKALYNVDVTIHLKEAYYNAPVEKPVIYLYPENTQAVTVELITSDPLTFTYPKYEDKWKVMANPNGKITQGNQSFNYLFWESQHHFEVKGELINSGNIVTKENSLAFLESKLDAFGLTSEEKADFITYWGPRMQEKEQWFVHFMLNEECNEMAELKIEPKPKHIYRLFMVLIPAEELTLNDVFEVQELQPIKREGFTVIEWGGSVVSKINL